MKRARDILKKNTSKCYSVLGIKLRFEGSNFSLHERAAKTKTNLAPSGRRLKS